MHRGERRPVSVVRRGIAGETRLLQAPFSLMTPAATPNSNTTASHYALHSSFSVP